MLISEQIRELGHQYDSEITPRKKECRSNKSIEDDCNDIKDMFYDIVLGHEGTLYSGKKVLYKADFEHSWQNYVTINHKYIGKQYRNDTSQQSKRLSGKELVSELVKNGDKIYDVMTNHENKKDKCKRYCAILNEHLDGNNCSEITTDSTEVNGEVYLPSADSTCQITEIKATLPASGDLSVDASYDSPNSSWSRSINLLHKHINTLMIYEQWGNEVADLIDSVIEKHEWHVKQYKVVKEIIEQEFEKDLVAARI